MIHALWPLAVAATLSGCRAQSAATPQTATATEATTPPTPAAESRACADGMPEGARCGVVTVFENRETREGKTIDLAYVVLPATEAEARQDDPVFVLAGGPGQAATHITVLAEGTLGPTHAHRDLVFVDQRGTGASNGLQCGPTDLDGMLQGPWSEANAGRIESCAASLPADLAQYATPTAMDDLDDVRVALGYGAINLWGGSYGTRAGLAYLRQHGAHVRSAALWGVAPPGQPFPRTFGPRGQAALERLMADCAGDDACRAVLPDGVAVVQRISERLEAEPAKLEVADPRDGRKVAVTLTRSAFTDGVRLALYDATWSAGLPAMLAAADQGNFQPLMQLLGPLAVGILTEIHFGMFLSVACAEDIPLLTDADQQDARKTFVGDTFMVGLRRACTAWPRAELPEGYLSPVESDVPVLLMAGELDPVTPPATAQLAAKALTRSRVVAFGNVSHGTSNAAACEAGLVADFFATADPDGIDPSCAASLSRPPFMVPR